MPLVRTSQWGLFRTLPWEAPDPSPPRYRPRLRSPSAIVARTSPRSPVSSGSAPVAVARVISAFALVRMVGALPAGRPADRFDQDTHGGGPGRRGREQHPGRLLAIVRAASHGRGDRAALSGAMRHRPPVFPASPLPRPTSHRRPTTASSDRGHRRVRDPSAVQPAAPDRAADNTPAPVPAAPNQVAQCRPGSVHAARLGTPDRWHILLTIIDKPRGWPVRLRRVATLTIAAANWRGGFPVGRADVVGALKAESGTRLWSPPRCPWP